MVQKSISQQDLVFNQCQTPVNAKSFPFWKILMGALLLLLVLSDLVVVTGVKQSQLLVQRLKSGLGTGVWQKNLNPDFRSEENVWSKSISSPGNFGL